MVHDWGAMKPVFFIGVEGEGVAPRSTSKYGGNVKTTIW
jgi:hypothetical protein